MTTNSLENIQKISIVGEVVGLGVSGEENNTVSSIDTESIQRLIHQTRQELVSLKDRIKISSTASKIGTDYSSA